MTSREPEGWWDATISARRGSVMLAAFFVSETLVLLHIDFDITYMGGRWLVPLLGLFFLFAFGFIDLAVVWRFRHGRRKHYRETFVKMGEGLERFLEGRGLPFEVSVRFDRERNRDLASWDDYGKASYRVAVDGDRVLLILDGWVSTESTRIAVEPWMEGRTAFRDLVNGLDEEFSDVKVDFVGKQSIWF